MAQVYSNSPGPRAGVDGAGSNTPQSNSGQDAVPILYPAIGPSKTPDAVADGSANADLSSTLGALSLTATAVAVVAATESTTLGLLTLTSAVTLPIVANESSTLGLLSLSSAGAVVVKADLSDTLGLLGLSAAGAAIVAGSLGQPLGLLSLSSDGTVIGGSSPITCDLDQTIGLLSLVSDGAVIPLPTGPDGPEGGISGYLKGRKMYHGGNLMLQPMSEATRRAEKIMVGWRDDEEAMLLVQIIETFYD